MMAREEAIEELERLLRHWDLIDEGIYDLSEHDQDAVEIALSALRAENAQLRAELNDLKVQWDMYGGDVGITETFKELERVKAERDAAQALLAERSGVIGSAPITTAFGVPLNRLKELVEADREGRCVVFPCKPGDTVYQLTPSICKWRETNKCDRCPGYGACWEGTTIIEPVQFEPDMIDSVGTDIFLTCAEAEEALRKGQE